MNSYLIIAISFTLATGQSWKRVESRCSYRGSEYKWVAVKLVYQQRCAHALLFSKKNNLICWRKKIDHSFEGLQIFVLHNKHLFVLCAMKFGFFTVLKFDGFRGLERLTLYVIANTIYKDKNINNFMIRIDCWFNFQYFDCFYVRLITLHFHISCWFVLYFWNHILQKCFWKFFIKLSKTSILIFF